MTRRGRRLLLGGAAVAVSVALVTRLIGQMDAERTLELLARLHPGWLALAIVPTLFVPLASVARWNGVLRAQPEGPLPFAVALRAVMIANALNSLLPSKAGDLAKSGYLVRRGGLVGGIASVVLERLVDLSVLGVLSLGAWAATGRLAGLVGAVVLLGGVAGIVLCGAFAPRYVTLPDKLARAAAGFGQVFRHWRACPGAVVQTVGASLAVWGTGAFTVYALGRAVGGALGLAEACAVFPLAILAGLLPLTVSGIGTRDAAFVALLSGTMALEEATLVGLGYTLVAYWFLALVSLPFVAGELWLQFGPRATRQETTERDP